MKTTKAFKIAILFCVLYSSGFTQVEWKQKLDGWINETYQPYLFLGGSYLTRVSFADIDADGDYDMFFGGGGTCSFKLFENTGTPESPVFKLKEIAVPGLTASCKGCLFDADFADLDGDNDLDVVISGSVSGALGRFINTGDNRNPLWKNPLYEEQNAIQGRGAMSIADYDLDGDYDVISGNSGDSIRYCEQRNDPFPLYFHLVDTTLGDINPGPLYYIDVEDLDGDRDFDLIACVTGGVNKYYENIGAPGIDSLHWVLKDSTFLLDQYEPDWIECPELVDIDADSDLDLFIAGANAHLNYFENIGDMFNPRFEHRYDTVLVYVFPNLTNRATLVDLDADGDNDIAANSMLIRNLGPLGDPHWSIETESFPRYSSYRRTFCDIDGDNDYDILCPHDRGITIVCNIGTPEQPEWGALEYFLQDPPYTNDLSFVRGVDIDGDDDYDLMLGGYYYKDITFYENVGDKYIPEFKYVTNRYLGFNAEMDFDPIFGDIDVDGDLDLLISYKYNSSLRSKLFYYENIGTSYEAVWDSVTDDYMGWFSSGMVNHNYVDLGDYDGDGDDDVLMSGYLGLLLFLNQSHQNDTSSGDENY